jgi:hypothetical protein
MLGKNFIFIEPPKNATTSIRAVLKGDEVSLYEEMGGVDRHAPAWFVKNVLGDHIWNNLYTFTVVRHPVERVISEFNYSKKVAAPWDGSVQGGEHDRYRMACIRLHEQCNDINDFVSLLRVQFLEMRKRSEGSATPQRGFHNMYGRYVNPIGFPSNYILSKTQVSTICSPYGAPLVKKVCRFESLQSDFNEVCDELGRERVDLPKLNASAHGSNSDCLSDESVRVLRDLLSDDFKTFGYE